MDTIFFDYYHPWAGLCNQLYLITNHIHYSYLNQTKIYIHKFNTDIFNKNRIPFSEVFDIDRTNENFKKLTGMELLSSEPPSVIKKIDKLCIYPVSSIPLLASLEFHGSILEKVVSIKTKLGVYNGVHFRLDADCIVHYVFGKETYNNFMKDPSIFLQLDQAKIKNYSMFLLKNYISFIDELGYSNPWYICTSLTKNAIHDPMLGYLSEFIEHIVSHGGSYFIPPVVYPDRELNALVDLLVLRDSNCLIGFEGSSFSEGYCLKVNSVRKVISQFRFVKEFDS